MSSPPLCGAILAGGASRRMGVDKALLQYNGLPLIAHSAAALRQVCDTCVVVTSTEVIASATALPAIADTRVGKGPLGGIGAALAHFAAPVLVVACDMPYLNVHFLRYLCARGQNGGADEWDAVVPRVAGRYEPLCALYNRSCIPLIEEGLALENVPSLQAILAQLRVRVVEESEARRFDASLRMFENWNTPADIPAG